MLRRPVAEGGARAYRFHHRLLLLELRNLGCEGPLATQTRAHMAFVAATPRRSGELTPQAGSVPWSPMRCPAISLLSFERLIGGMLEEAPKRGD